MGPADRADRQRLSNALVDFNAHQYPLPGLQPARHRDVYVTQLIESIRRVRYIAVIQQRDISALRADPMSDLFDPLKGAAYLRSQGQIDEAFWQVFIFVHFGRHRRYGWRTAKSVYSGLGSDTWDWVRVSTNPEGFRQWLRRNQAAFTPGGPNSGFGNHRKYQSLKADGANSTGEAVVSYVNWIGASGSHRQFIEGTIRAVGADPRALFARLYDSMAQVAAFGRTARFDYLTMLGKLHLAPIIPDRPYLQGSTGPLRGAKLLFHGSQTAPGIATGVLDARVRELGSALQVGMQEMEDSLCNWQKSPAQFMAYRG